MLKSHHNTLCLAGTLFSSYALYVNYAHKNDNNFTPVFGSTTAFSSEFGKGLGGLVKGENFIGNLLNSTLGVVFYIFMAMISHGALWENAKASKVRLFFSIASGVPSLWLGYILMFILHVSCGVSFMVYGINAALIWINWNKFMELKNKNDNKKSD